MTTPTAIPDVLGRVRASVAPIGVSLAVTGALMLALLGLGTPTASAGSNERIDVKYGYVRFDSEGEKLYAADIWGPDHRGVRAYLNWAGGNGASITDGPGGYESVRDLFIPEGTKVTLTLCYTKRGVDDTCTDFERAVA